LQDHLDKVAAAARNVDLVQLRGQTGRATASDPSEQERLFQRFLEWNKKQSRQ